MGNTQSVRQSAEMAEYSMNTLIHWLAAGESCCNCVGFYSV